MQIKYLILVLTLIFNNQSLSGMWGCCSSNNVIQNEIYYKDILEKIFSASTHEERLKTLNKLIKKKGKNTQLIKRAILRNKDIFNALFAIDPNTKNSLFHECARLKLQPLLTFLHDPEILINYRYNPKMNNNKANQQPKHLAKSKKTSRIAANIRTQLNKMHSQKNLFKEILNPFLRPQPLNLKKINYDISKIIGSSNQNKCDRYIKVKLCANAIAEMINLKKQNIQPIHIYFFRADNQGETIMHKLARNNCNMLLEIICTSEKILRMYKNMRINPFIKKNNTSKTPMDIAKNDSQNQGLLTIGQKLFNRITQRNFTFSL